MLNSFMRRAVSQCALRKSRYTAARNLSVAQYLRAPFCGSGDTPHAIHNSQRMSFNTNAFARRTPELQELENAAKLNMIAAANNVAELKEAISSGIDVNSADYDFRTPLHIAAASGHFETVEYLLENGAVSTPDRFGGLPIHDATRSNHQEIANLLKEHPVEIASIFDPNKDVNAEAMQTVFNLVVKEGVFSFTLVASEIQHFFNELNMDSEYFRIFTEAQMAKHVHSLIAAKKVAFISRQPTNIKVDIQDEETLFYMFTSQNAAEVERRVEKYISETPEGYHLAYVKSRSPFLSGHSECLQMYYVERCRYENPNQPGNTDVYATSTPDFLRNHKGLASLKQYEKVVEEAVLKPYPVFVSKKAEKNIDGHGGLNANYGYDMKVAVNLGGAVEGTSNQEVFLRKVNRTFQRLGVDMHSSSINSFSNGVSVYSAYCDVDEEALHSMENYLSLALLMPESALLEHYFNGSISGRQLMYLHSASRFAYYFQYAPDEDFDSLYETLKNDPINQSKLARLGPSLGNELNSLDRLYQCVQNNMDVSVALYNEFSRKFTGEWDDVEYPDLNNLISSVSDKEDRSILRHFMKFNEAVTSTNLWKGRKSAIAYRLDPQHFLDVHKIPEIPYAVYMILGLNFNGFHVRFRDISRGGVRVIKSTPTTYINNRATQFIENYNLAYTQQLKNKDIPEGGSKGTILLKKGKNFYADLAFRQYADSILDIMLKEDGVKDISNHPELIFLGPDEYTADFMDPGCIHSRSRGYQFWRSFTTGKSPDLGGIPHDTYGMTTRSVRAYVTGLIDHYNLKQEDCTKVMTGGPDGDLGSNEILMSKEKIVAVVDGSGVLCDPEGINREQLEQLATKRLMCDKFDESCLSDKGFLVRITDKDRDLPCGYHVNDGVSFRNNFHVWDGITADFFVPCGGRPGSVHLGNVHQMFKEDGSPRYKYVVEGANLFITDGARDLLQDSGVILFKDASTNKGGVTSSSLEVLAGLSMTDQEFASNMQVSNEGVVPEFYKEYVDEVCKKVEQKARDEFKYIHQTAIETGKRRTVLTGQLSQSMNDLSDMIGKSPVFDDDAIRKKVLAESIPVTLQNKFGLDNVLDRVPAAYQRAIFSMHLASQYVYEHGSEQNPYQFYEFMRSYDQKK